MFTRHDEMCDDMGKPGYGKVMELAHYLMKMNSTRDITVPVNESFKMVTRLWAQLDECDKYVEC